MKVMRAAVAVAGVGLLLGTTTWVAAQVNVDKYHADRLAYESGYSQGQWDAQHGHSPDPDDNHFRDKDNRREFRKGYELGYREFRGNRTLGSSRSTAGLDLAQKYGYEDGVNDGARDRSTRHAFRATHSYSYQDADRGYRASFENRYEYRRVYREAYAQGYRLGYRTGVLR
jgi:hypothetical protein